MYSEREMIINYCLFKDLLLLNRIIFTITYYNMNYKETLIIIVIKSQVARQPERNYYADNRGKNQKDI